MMGNNMGTKKVIEKVTSENFFDMLKSSVEEVVGYVKGKLILKDEILESPVTMEDDEQ